MCLGSKVYVPDSTIGINISSADEYFSAILILVHGVGGAGITPLPLFDP